MGDNTYNNPDHWTAIHKRFSGTLRAVGRSGLSETYNRYKYRSEEVTFSEAFFDIILKDYKGKNLNVLEIGAGIGYWLNVVKSLTKRRHLDCNLNALDLSEHALTEIKKTLPEANCILENAGLVSPLMFESGFDLVMANYCLHHITQTGQFINALELAVKSVKPGGYLLLMDCFIDRAYSPVYQIDPAVYTGSGLTRPLQMVDQVCEKNQMHMIYRADPISFLMNNVLEANSSIEFSIKYFIWKCLHRLYKSDLASRIVLPFVYPLDMMLKKAQMGCSTRLLIYRKHMDDEQDLPQHK